MMEEDSRVGSRGKRRGVSHSKKKREIVDLGLCLTDKDPGLISFSPPFFALANSRQQQGIN